MLSKETPNGGKHGFDRDLVSTPVANRTIAFDRCLRARIIVTFRLENRSNWIKRLPMPGTGRTKDCDCGRSDGCRYVHQTGIVGDCKVSCCQCKYCIAK